MSFPSTNVPSPQNTNSIFNVPLSLGQLQNVVSSMNVDLGVVEQIVAGLQHQIADSLQLIKNSLLPAGSIVCYAGLQIPADFHVCDGTAFAIADFEALYAALGSTYNTPDTNAAVYFNIPDLRGMFVRGFDYDRGLDSNRPLGSAQAWATAAPVQTPFEIEPSGAHKHAMNFALAVQSGNTTPCFATVAYNGFTSQSTNTAGEHVHSISGGDAETRPVNMALNYLIKIY